MKPNLLDRALLAVAPGRALERARARRMASAFFGTTEGGEHRGADYRRRPHTRGSPDAKIARNGPWMREQARCLEDTYDVVESIIDTFVRAIVGAEVRFEPQVMNVDGTLHEEVNRELVHWFKIWSRYPEVTREYDYHEGCRQHVRSWVRDGEMFQQYVEGFIPSLEHGSDVPLSIEHVQSDFVPFGYTVAARGITQGVQKNAWGRPTGYHLYKHHPGDLRAGNGYGTPDKFVPAAIMIHHKHSTHFRQTRGLPILAPVFGRIEDLKETDENERIAARCAAAMVGFRTRSKSEDWSGDEATADDEIGFEPGSVYDLAEGESMSIHASNRPNNALLPFIEHHLRSIAGGVGANYSSIARDYSGTYSSQRQELVEGYVGYGVMHADLAGAKLWPDWKRFVDALIKYRLLVLPADALASTVHDVDIPRPPMPWIDPKKEAEGSIALVDAELESPTHVMRMRGRNPTIVRAQIEQDRKWRSAQKTDAQAVPAPNSDEEDDDEDDD